MTTLEFGTDISILGDFVTDIFRFQVIWKFHDGSVLGHFVNIVSIIKAKDWMG